MPCQQWDCSGARARAAATQWDTAANASGTVQPGSPGFITVTHERQSPEGNQGPFSKVFPWSVQGQFWELCPGACGTAQGTTHRVGGSSGAGRSG